MAAGRQRSDHQQGPPSRHLACWLQLVNSEMPNIVAALEARGMRDVSANIVYAKPAMDETLSYQMSKLAG